MVIGLIDRDENNAGYIPTICGNEDMSGVTGAGTIALFCTKLPKL
jgi:hypothetical protein